MELTHVELSNFRSIGSEPVCISLQQRCTVLIGPNNAGKSNVIKALQIISAILDAPAKKSPFPELDIHQRDHKLEFRFTLRFKADSQNAADMDWIRGTGCIAPWFTFSWGVGQPRPEICDYSLATLKDFDKANRALAYITNEQWTRRVGETQMRERFLEKPLTTRAFTKIGKPIPPIRLIPVFRQIRPAKEYELDGRGLVELLGYYQEPAIGKDQDQEKFREIREFMRRLLHLPDATLGVTRETQEIVIANDGIRLPLVSYGTGVHQTLMLVVAALSVENSLCCIEEPEIQLHPRLQRELLDFLITHTSNRYLLTTHSSTFINAVSSNAEICVIQLKCENGITTGGPILEDNQRFDVLRDLGINPSDLLQANCIIWVEGTSDRHYLKRWLALLAPDLVEGQHFAFMFYRQLPRLHLGGELPHKEVIEVLRLNRNAIIVMDSDLRDAEAGMRPDKMRIIQQCKEANIMCWVTDGREIENYLSPGVVVRAFKEMHNIEIDLPILDQYADFAVVVDGRVASMTTNVPGYGKCKPDYARKIAALITEEDIQEDLRIHLLEVIETIREWNR